MRRKGVFDLHFNLRPMLAFYGAEVKVQKILYFFYFKVLTKQSCSSIILMICDLEVLNKAARRMRSLPLHKHQKDFGKGLDKYV